MRSLAADSNQPKGSDAVKAQAVPTVTPKPTKNSDVASKGAEEIKKPKDKSQLAGDEDILKGAGLFKFATQKELLQKWKVMSPARYDLKLGTENIKVGDVT